MQTSAGASVLPARTIGHPAFANPVRVVTLQRPEPADDEATTAQTIAFMRYYATRDAAAPAITAATAAAIREARARTPEQTAAAIHRWIRRRVRFTADSTLAGFADDPAAAEVLIPPVDLLSMPQPTGDCDDFAQLAAAMLTAAGIECSFVTIAADDSSPDYSHVYVRAELPHGPVAFDASHGPHLGWNAPPTGKLRIWPLYEKEEKEQMRRRNVGDVLDTTTTLPDTFGVFAANPTINAGSAGSSGPGINWTSIIGTGLNDAEKILAPRYAVPQLAPGQYIQTAQGVMYQQPLGSSTPFSLPALGIGTGNSNLLLYLAIAGIALAVLSGKH